MMNEMVGVVAGGLRACVFGLRALGFGTIGSWTLKDRTTSMHSTKGVSYKSMKIHITAVSFSINFKSYFLSLVR